MSTRWRKPPDRGSTVFVPLVARVLWALRLERERDLAVAGCDL